MTTKQEVKPVDEVMMSTMTLEGIVAQQRLVKDVMARVMHSGKHYGIIPGCDKPSLWKPGAEVLCMTFRLSPSFASDITMDGPHMTVRTICTLTHIPTGKVFGTGEALCSTKEKKYRLRKEGGRIVENQNLPDSYNTVVKMCNKRALVAAVLVATAASEVFTQDMEDSAEPLVVLDTEAAVKEPKAQEKEGEKETKRQEKPKDDKDVWIGRIKSVEALQLPDGTPCWNIRTEDGLDFKTVHDYDRETAEGLLDTPQGARIKFKRNAKGTLVIQRMEVVNAG
jgi:hypothetical protein